MAGTPGESHVSQFEHPIGYFYDTNGNKWWQNSIFVIYEGDYLVTVTPMEMAGKSSTESSNTYPTHIRQEIKQYHNSAFQ